MWRVCQKVSQNPCRTHGRSPQSEPAQGFSCSEVLRHAAAEQARPENLKTTALCAGLPRDLGAARGRPSINQARGPSQIFSEQKCPKSFCPIFLTSDSAFL